METTELFDVAVREIGSPDGVGRARRDAMREDLLGAVDRRRRRRRMSRGAACAALLVAGALLIVPLLSPPASPAGRPGLRSGGDVPGIAIVRDDPTVVARLGVAVASTTPIPRVTTRPLAPGTVLDDVGLLHWLERAGHPSAVVRIRGAVMLTNPLTD